MVRRRKCEDEKRLKQNNIWSVRIEANTCAELSEEKKVAGESFEFVFLLDCSGSMDGINITQAKRALKLFIQV